MFDEHTVGTQLSERHAVGAQQTWGLNRTTPLVQLLEGMGYGLGTSPMLSPSAAALAVTRLSGLTAPQSPKSRASSWRAQPQSQLSGHTFS